MNRVNRKLTIAVGSCLKQWFNTQPRLRVLKFPFSISAPGQPGIVEVWTIAFRE